MKDLAVYRLAQREFPALRQACGADPDFPKNWTAWEEMLETAFAQATAAGLSHPRFELDVAQFVTWCVGMEIIPCLDALRAYAIIQRTPNFSDSSQAQARNSNAIRALAEAASPPPAD